MGMVSASGGYIGSSFERFHRLTMKTRHPSGTPLPFFTLGSNYKKGNSRKKGTLIIKGLTGEHVRDSRADARMVSYWGSQKPEPQTPDLNGQEDFQREVDFSSFRLGDSNMQLGGLL